MIRETSKHTAWARVNEVLNSAIGPNSDYPSFAEIARHRAAQLAHDAAQPNHMQHLHVGDFVALTETVDIITSFELAAVGLIVRYGEREGSPIWLIDRPHSRAALFVASGSTGRMVAQPFDLDHFVAVGADVASQTINESMITDSCDLGGGLVFRVGTRDGAPIFVMQNDDAAGMCAVWYDGARPH